jgi:hypothetical protein
MLERYERATRVFRKHNGSAHQRKCRSAPIWPDREWIFPTVASGHARVMSEAMFSNPMVVDRVLVPRG